MAIINAGGLSLRLDDDDSRVDGSFLGRLGEWPGNVTGGLEKTFFRGMTALSATAVGTLNRKSLGLLMTAIGKRLRLEVGRDLPGS